MKRMISLLMAAALVLSLAPVGALAAEGTPEGQTPSACICEGKCTEENVNSACPVCGAEGADLTVCKGEASQPEQSQEDGNPPAEPQEQENENPPAEQENPAPVCTCTTKCADGAVNPDCPVCSAEDADLSACQGTEPQQPQVTTITEWSWFPALAQDGKLYLPAAVTEASLAGVTDTLPKNIEANGQNIPVSWTYDWNTQAFTASLPEGYALAEGAAPLTVAVVVMDANPLPATDTGLTIGNQSIPAASYWTTGSGTLIAANEGDSWNVHYDAEANVLTLRNAVITGGIEYSGSSLTIELEGTNQVSSSSDGIFLAANSGAANLTIRGSGSLAVASNSQGYGIQVLSGDGTGASLTVQTCALTVDGNPGIYFGSNSGGVSASLTIDNSALVRSGGGIEANGGTAVTSTGTGIVFSENKGTVYGAATLNSNLTVNKGETLTIPSGASLTVSDGVSLTNNGAITNEGAINNNGTVTNCGTISGSVTGNPVVTIVSNVPYMENGSLKHATATVVTGSASDVTWTEGWYVVEGDVTIGQRVTVSGDVKLILADNCRLTVNSGINVLEGNALTIYGQSGGTGILEATGSENSAGIGGGMRDSVGAITINGGSITANGGKYGAGIGSGMSGSVGTITINGGTVNATGDRWSAGIGAGDAGKGGTITVNGGSITANGSENGAGIGGNGTTLTGNIGYAIKASSISADTADFNGIVCSETAYQVYGNVVLAQNLELQSGETLTVPDGASLTIPDASMITGDGVVGTSGTGVLMMEPEGPEDITISQEFYYTGNDLSQNILDAVFINAEKEVTVASQQVTVHLISEGWAETLKEGSAVNAGTYTVQFTKSGKTIEKSVTVAQSGSTLENNVNTDKAQYTYGETITVTATPKATGASPFALTPPTSNQMAVYTQDGNTQLSQAVNPDSKGVYTMTLDSTELGAGPHILMVKYTGNGNQTAASQEISVVIQKATPNVSIPTGLTAVIGSTLADVTLPSGWAWKDPDTDVGNVGEHSFPAVFTPTDTANYNILERTLTVNVSKPDLSAATVTLGASLTYNGGTQTQTVTVTLNGQALVEGKDYTLTGTLFAKDAGTYTLTVTGKGNYTGTTSKTFTIAKAPLTIASVDVQNKTYDGTTAATVTGVSFKGLVNGEALAMGTDYTALADFADAAAGTGKSVTGKVTLLSSAVGKNYTLSGNTFAASANITIAPSKLDFKADRTKPVKGQVVIFSVTPQLKGDNRSFLQRVLGIDAPKVEFWVGSTKLGEVKVEEGKTSTFAYDTDKGGLKLGKNTVTAKFTGSGNLQGCEESLVIYLHDSTTSAPTGDTSNIGLWTAALAVSVLALAGVGVGTVLYRKKRK